MQYTIWSRGRLLGETDLGFVRRIRNYRMGWLRPTAEGEKVLPIATGLTPAIHAYVNRAQISFSRLANTTRNSRKASSTTSSCSSRR